MLQNYSQESLMITDNDTVVSTLSHDKESVFREQRGPVVLLSRRTEPLPTEVVCCTPARNLSHGNIASANSTERRTLTQMTHGVPSRIIQPTLLRHSSSPINHQQIQKSIMERSYSCPTDLDKLCNVTKTDSTVSTCSILEDSVYVDDTVTIPGAGMNRSGFFGQQQQGNYSTSYDDQLIGNRKRRTIHRSNSDSAIKFGSLVGESVLVDEGLAPIGDTDKNEALRITKALQSTSLAKKMLLLDSGAGDGIGCCQARQPSSFIKKELKYVANKFISPMRTLPLLREKKTELRRAKGRLV